MTRGLVRAFEEHGEVLAHWHRQGWSRECVVVLDHHLDLKRIAADQLARVRDGARGGGLDRLHRDLPFRDDDRFAYGLDSFLYAAADLGLIERVVWVLPEPRPRSAAQLADVLWSALSLLPGHGHEVLGSFVADDVAARARVGGLRVEATTLRRLSRLELRGARLDVDLDFFHDGGPDLTHEPAGVAAELAAAGLLDDPPAMTHSIASGFMPERLRPLGARLAAAMGFAFAPSTPRPQQAARSLAVVARAAPASHAELAELTASELDPLGGPGMALRAVLCARADRLGEAAEAHAEARRLGDRATWPAYELGLRHLARREPGAAAEWFARAEGDLVDTMQAHSLSLRALAECRRGDFAAGLAAALRCLERIPLRAEPYQLASIAAARLGRAHELDEVRARLERLQATRKDAGL
ncbi:hypothetical protein [Nannocystis sp. SCPEA4]|uniref:hypothetical protein n=1 Tax=Nannocystis sp. SCPEA4 TaxID=2996787 RepID=UPI00226F8DD5|nr:hypothetical protein [Nannocystis sp. SCPEA4]MCY1062663.1 hypothetical protein [Nannocystis sp. SCPEA4]